MGRFVIALYTPKPGKGTDLEALVAIHVGILREQNLATDRPAYMMKAKDGSILEVFEWCSSESVAEAHTNAVVQALWGKFSLACDYAPLNSIEECAGLFAEFEPLAPAGS
jgi:hypothetical protein